MTLRRLWVLVGGLPQDSCLARAQHGEAADWRIGDYIAARLANDFRIANSSKKVPDAALIQPPGTRKPRPRPRPPSRG